MARGRHLNWTDRLLIEKYLRHNHSVSQIADLLHVSRQTIYNELNRGRYTKIIGETYETVTAYSPDIAQERHDQLKSVHGAALKIGSDHRLAKYIEQKIIDHHYSPAAVLAEIKRNNLQFSTTICKTTLYSYIRKGVFLHLTYTDLPNRGTYRKRRYNRIKAVRPIYGESIEHRPNIEDRTEFGHWEMDTVIGKLRTKPILLVLTERKTRYELIIKLQDKTTKSVVDALGNIERKYSAALFPKIFRTITVDNGVEFADRNGIERSILSKPNSELIRTKLYYCHPYSAYERGSNENINKMIRRFFPKGFDFRKTDQKYIATVQNWINHYPRKVLDYQSADELFETEMHNIRIS